MIRSNYSVSRIAWAFSGSAAFGAIMCLSQLAAAQQVDEFGAYRPPGETYSRETSRNFAFELRFGPYLPRVDSEFTNGKTPFKQYFGTSNRVMLGMEFDWLPMTIPDVLRVGVGAGISYTTMSAKALMYQDDTARSSQDTGFRVMPHWVVGVAKLDVINRKTPIPVIFVGKLGLANALWWVNDYPSPNSADGVAGKGSSQGIYYGLGAGLDLGILDPIRAKRLDSTTGINSVYLYGEFYGMELSSFGASNAMHIGDRTWLLGLSFDI